MAPSPPAPSPNPNLLPCAALGAEFSTRHIGEGMEPTLFAELLEHIRAVHDPRRNFHTMDQVNSCCCSVLLHSGTLGTQCASYLLTRPVGHEHAA